MSEIKSMEHKLTHCHMLRIGSNYHLIVQTPKGMWIKIGNYETSTFDSQTQALQWAADYGIKVVIGGKDDGPQ